MILIGKALALLQSTAVLVTLLLVFASSTAALTMRTITLGAQVSAAGAQAAATAIAHRKAIAAAVAREKAKGRLKRYIVAVPLAGTAAAAGFEYVDYREWSEANPDGTAGEYSCEVAINSAAVLDEVLQELPERARPSRDFVLGLLPECEQED